MSSETVRSMYQRVAEYLADHDGNSFKFIWHGGEPLAVGRKAFHDILKMQKEFFSEEISIKNSLHTNATLIDTYWLKLFSDFKVGVSVSIDGPKPINDVRRLTRSGRSSYTQTLQGIRTLQNAGFSPAVLCVLQGDISGSELYNFLTREVRAAKVDLLLPLSSHEHDIVPSSQKINIAKQAIEAFDAWYDDPNGDKYTIRWFKEALRNMLGGCAHLCTMQERCEGILTIATNGEIYLCEDLSVAGSIYRTGKKITNCGIKEAQNYWFEKIHIKGLEEPDKCKACSVYGICKGGCPATRFSSDTLFSEPSSHCDIFKSVYTHIANRAAETLYEGRSS